MGFNLDNYEQVKDRITRFYVDHPDGRIITELVSDTNKLESFAAFKAHIYLGDVLKSTGYAYESQGQGVNRDAWVENAETSAIGRGLANMDYCGTLRPSREEMSKVGNTPEPKSDGSDIVKSQCVSIAEEIKLSEDKKKTLWVSAGKNWSNFLVLLKAEQKIYHEQIDAAWNDVTAKIIQAETIAASV